jgi:hypothetical protein
MIGGGLRVIRQKGLWLEVVKVVNLGDFHLTKDLTVYHRFNLFYIKIDLKTIILNFNGRKFFYSYNTVDNFKCIQ